MSQTSNGTTTAAFLIDPETRTIEPVQLTGKPTPLAEIYQLLGCKLITTAPLDGGDVVYVDDEGLINGPVYQFFGVRGFGQPLAGRGLVVGVDDDGNDASPRISLDELTARVVFIERLFENLYTAGTIGTPRTTMIGVTLAELSAFLAEGV